MPSQLKRLCSAANWMQKDHIGTEDVRCDLAWPWYWESMKLEGVCTVSVRGLLLQILWQVDDHDSVERAFLQKAVVAVKLMVHDNSNSAGTLGTAESSP